MTVSEATSDPMITEAGVFLNVPPPPPQRRLNVITDEIAVKEVRS